MKTLTQHHEDIQSAVTQLNELITEAIRDGHSTKVRAALVAANGDTQEKVIVNLTAVLK